ncbi:hypothetical protein, variant [Aphanomyces invadans]|uniref:Ras-GEF domain-containing protein n=1 Tax=Aphanomyces invadans TaxID=157072 RepID=A0A024UH57_9STRA|nr:hypothetical protein, variant [Aphanomyces invadans]ETW05634.1 hypothetical protein, variant [Aphanomyces invadans]|eukprot:XP_008865411.1 hypothetical protein, variant [Aphanomyces invadans]
MQHDEQPPVRKMPSVIYDRSAMSSERREITHATLGRLVAKLTDAQYHDADFRNCFLLTYRSHSSVNDFIVKLTKRYNAASCLAHPRYNACDPSNADDNKFSVAADATVQAAANVSMMRAMNMLKFWIRESGYIESDLDNDRRSQKKLMIFLAKVRDESPHPSISKHAGTMMHVVGKILVRNTPISSRLALATPSVMPSPLDLGSESSDESPKAARRKPVTIDEDCTLASTTAAKLKIVRSTSTDTKAAFKAQVTIRAYPSADHNHRHRSYERDMTRPAFSALPPSISRGKTMPQVSTTHQSSATAPVEGGCIHTPLTRSVSDNTRDRRVFSVPRSEPFNGISAQDVADQLTLLEEHMFHKVQHRELTNKNWTTEFKHDVAPNVMALIELFDARAEWVSSEILHPKLQAAQRASMVAFFIDVAEACYRMNNFNTHAEIVVGLTAPCIKQLETTWNLVAPGHLEKFEHLKHVCSSDDNFRFYRLVGGLSC